jgi:hypothetical protein
MEPRHAQQKKQRATGSGRRKKEGRSVARWIRIKERVGGSGHTALLVCVRRRPDAKHIFFFHDRTQGMFSYKNLRKIEIELAYW